MFLPPAALLLTRSLAAKIGHLQRPLAAGKPFESKYHLQRNRPVAAKKHLQLNNLQPNRQLAA